MVYIQELLIYICIRVSRDTYNRRGMSNMQLNDGRPGRMARGREVVVPPLVYDYSRTTGYEAAERYQQLQCYKGKKKYVAILLKRLRSRDMA